jgi:DNA repair protein RadA/Sms
MSFGELGLAGEVRPVKFGAERMAEAAKQGFSVAIVPQSNMPRDLPSGMKIIGVSKLEDALAQAFA